jgi:cytochrome P450
MHTPVPFVERETTKDLTVDGYFIPAGTLIDVHLYLLHHNKNVWKDPEDYIPERFDDDSSSEMSSFAFVPFSAGPR